MNRDSFYLPRDVIGLLQTLQSAGHTAYVVGGCVLDSLLGRTPGDWDICTSARPEEMRRTLEHLHQTYGSAEAYLLGPAGRTQAEVETLRERLRGRTQ